MQGVFHIAPDVEPQESDFLSGATCLRCGGRVKIRTFTTWTLCDDRPNAWRLVYATLPPWAPACKRCLSAYKPLNSPTPRYVRSIDATEQERREFGRPGGCEHHVRA